MEDVTVSGLETFSTSKTSFLLPKLKDDGSNWVLYQTQLTDYINGQPGFRKHLTGRAKPPKDLTDVEKKDADKVDTYEDSMDEYLQKQSAIRNLIHSTLQEKVRIRLMNPDHSVKDMWAELCSLYENQNVIVL